MTLQDYKTKLWDIVRKVYDLERDTGYLMDNEATKLEIDSYKASEVFDKEEASRLLAQLEECCRKAAYLLSPIQHEGEIVRLSNDQYELDGEILDSGTRVEVKLYDEEAERYHFVYSTIEHDSKGYYLTCNGSRELTGLEARLR